MAATFDAQQEIARLLQRWGRWSAPSDGAERFRWGDTNSPNSIVDAERLVTLLLPVTQLPRHSLDEPTKLTEDQVILFDPSLRSGSKLVQRLIDELFEFYQRYERDGELDFSAGSYLESPSGEPVPENVEVLDSYTMSVTLCVFTLLLVASWKTVEGAEDIKWERLEDLKGKACVRLTAAMRGMLASFSVTTADNKYAPPDWEETLEDVVAGINLLDSRIGNVLPDRQFFECGWSWGPLHPHDRILTGADAADTGRLVSHDGIYAQPAPYLYFSVNAIDGIADLFSEDVRRQNILNDEQSALANTLRRCWELTHRYWSTCAFSSVDDDRWLVEDLPWRTTDHERSDYSSLMVAGVAIQSAGSVFSENVAAVPRLASVLNELAQRSRITRRSVPVRRDGRSFPDPALALHYPGGTRLRLLRRGDQADDPSAGYSWLVYDVAPQLLKRAARLLRVARRSEERKQLRTLIQAVWSHLAKRTVAGPKMIMWDDPLRVFPELAADLGREDEEEDTLPRGSWYITERVMEALVACAVASDVRPTPSQSTVSVATDLLAEADYYIARRSAEAGLNETETLDPVHRYLDSARELLNDSPGRAAAYLLLVLEHVNKGKDLSR